jgi:hypothetical protein
VIDSESCEIYKRHHNWFNRLWVSQLFNYNCGSSGDAVRRDGNYIVRPISKSVNNSIRLLARRRAFIKEIKAGDNTQTPAGYFWCEYFKGKHISANYSWNNSLQKWNNIISWEGDSSLNEWKRVGYFPEVPSELDCLMDIEDINIEFKGDKIIKVHLYALIE